MSKTKIAIKYVFHCFKKVKGHLFRTSDKNHSFPLSGFFQNHIDISYIILVAVDKSKMILNDSPFNFGHQMPTKCTMKEGIDIFHTYLIGCAFGGDITCTFIQRSFIRFGHFRP